MNWSLLLALPLWSYTSPNATRLMPQLRIILRYFCGFLCDTQRYTDNTRPNRRETFSVTSTSKHHASPTRTRQNSTKICFESFGVIQRWVLARHAHSMRHAHLTPSPCPRRGPRSIRASRLKKNTSTRLKELMYGPMPSPLTKRASSAIMSGPLQMDGTTNYSTTRSQHANHVAEISFTTNKRTGPHHRAFRAAPTTAPTDHGFPTSWTLPSHWTEPLGTTDVRSRFFAAPDVRYGSQYWTPPP